MSKRSLKQIEEGLRRKLDEFYEVPVRDIMPGAELDPKKITEPLRRAPGLYAGPNLSSPDLAQNAAGVASAAGRISGGRTSGRIEPTLGTTAPAAPVRPNIISKNQWKKLTSDQKQDMANKLGSTKPKAPTRPDAEIFSKPTFTSPRAWYKKLAKEKGIDVAEKYKNYYTTSTGNEKLPSWGSRTGTAGKYGAYGLGAAGLYQLVKPDEQKPDQEKPADTDTTSDKPVDKPVDRPTTSPAGNSSTAGTGAKGQSELPQDDTDSTAQVAQPQTVEPVKTPPPNKPYPPGTKFSPDEILETYNRVLNRYRNFLYEETDEERKQAETLKAIQRSIYGMESGFGKAKTDRPNYAGAIGPMQIMPKTFQWMKEKNIIPKDFDIKNPEQNKQAGNALIGHYFQKYQGDPAKVYAAYYAGPGAIRKDGSINTHWRDRKNPKAPNVGNYIDAGLAKAGLSDVKYVAAKPSTTTTAAVPTKPVKPPPDVTPSVAKADIVPEPEQPKLDTVVDKLLQPTNVAVKEPEFKDLFDYDAFHKAAKAGQDLSDISKFMKSAKTTADLFERYLRYKMTETR